MSALRRLNLGVEQVRAVYWILRNQKTTGPGNWLVLLRVGRQGGSKMALEKEQAVYARELPKLLAQEGKHVLIHGDTVVGVYDTYNDALKVGYEQFGLDPFLVKRIQAVEQVHCFTRDLSPCRI
jgi:hypothetical protein